MFLIPLDPVPNQRCSVRLDGALFVLEVKQARNLMVISIERDGIALVRGVRCLPALPLIPYNYLQGTQGNFYFLNADGQYPQYKRFGTKDNLYYLALEEEEALHHE